MIERIQTFIMNIASPRKLSYRVFAGKKAAMLYLALAGGMVSAQAQANTCMPSGGSTQQYNFLMDYNLPDATENTTGRIINAAYRWQIASFGYGVTCECSGSYTPAFITAKVPDTGLAYSDGRLNFYSINDYLAVASEVWVEGGVNSYIATPFTGLSNLATTNISCTSGFFRTGSQGSISLYFKRPFVGVQTIPVTRLVDVYVATDPTTESTVPVATVWMSGTVTVPQSCVINGGGVINVPFGDIMSGDISTKGEMAKNFTPRKVDLTVACSNISDGVKVSLSFQGTPDANDPTLLSSTNANLGIRIQDPNGATVAPLSGRLPITMNYAEDPQVGTSSINLSPVNTTGEEPDLGNFTATATINAEIQ